MTHIRIALLFVFFLAGAILHVQGEIKTPTPENDVLEIAQDFAGNNDDWTPYERDFDGVAMMLVPAGCFMMGIDGSPVEGMHRHEVCLSQPFWIDKTEVTQSNFERLGGEKENQSEFTSDFHPVENITWFEAQAFCVLRGGRLPTEAEWEYAVRGPDSLVYPWGNEWDESKVVWNWWESQGTAEVGSIPAGASWVGALDMSGNVWEWTSSLFAPYPYDADDGREDDTDEDEETLRVLRGGSWFELTSRPFSTWFREWHRPNHFDISYGFRCVREIG